MPLNYLIVGATGGIGSSLTKLLAKDGHRSCLLGRNPAKLEQLINTVHSEYPDAELKSIAFNLMGAQPQDYETLEQRLSDTWGHLDGLLWCAGSLGQQAPIGHLHPFQWWQNIQTNVFAPVFLTQLCLPLLEKSPCGGTILFPQPKAAFYQHAYRGAYGMSQGALTAFLQILSEELAGIQVRLLTCELPKVASGLIRAAYPGNQHAAEISAETAANQCYALLNETVAKEHVS